MAKLSRDISQWRGMKPEAVAEGSDAQIVNCIRDLQHDVLALADANADMLTALKAMLAHSCVADAGADMKDSEDHAAERMARAIIAKAEGRTA